jgi:hypothetical protein
VAANRRPRSRIALIKSLWLSKKLEQEIGELDKLSLGAEPLATVAATRGDPSVPSHRSLPLGFFVDLEKGAAQGQHSTCVAVTRRIRQRIE